MTRSASGDSAMRRTVNLPKLGDTVNEVVVVKWLVEEGQQVLQGEPVVRVETEKTETEVESPLTGVLVERLVAADDEVETGAPLFVVDVSTT